MMWLKIILIFVILSLSYCDDVDEQVNIDEQVDVKEQPEFIEASEDTTSNPMKINAVIS